MSPEFEYNQDALALFTRSHNIPLTTNNTQEHQHHTHYQKQHHHRHHHTPHQQHRHVHFNSNNNNNNMVPEETINQHQHITYTYDSSSVVSNNSHNSSNNKLEVSCEHNPTQLFLLMNQQLWDSASMQLQRNPTEARTWITSRSNDGEYKWSHLPLHLACLHGPTPVPLQFIEALIQTYPNAVQCRNHENSLPIHLACECMDFSPRFELEVEGILVTLIKSYPESLSMKDSLGRRPIDILEAKGIRSGSKMNKFMKIMEARAGNKSTTAVDSIPFVPALTRMVEEQPWQEKRDDEVVKPRRRSPKHNMTSHGSDEIHMMALQQRRENAMGMTYNSKSTSPVRRDPSPTVEQQQPLPYLPSNTISSKDGSAAHHFSQRGVNGLASIKPQSQEPSSSVIESATTPSSNHRMHNMHPPPPIVSPHGFHPASSMVSPQNSINMNTMCTSPSARHIMNPFHFLDAELRSLRSDHETMSHLLSIKTENENELQERVRKLVEENEQTKLDFDSLSIKHADTLKELEQMKMALEYTNYELRIKKQQEKLLSSELALKLAVEEKQGIEFKELKSTLENEKEARIGAVEKLENQMKLRVDLEEGMEVIKSENEQYSRENEKLLKENKELHAQISQNKIDVQEAKAQGEKLLGLVSKLHSPEQVKEEVGLVRSENEQLSTENRKLHKHLQETKTKVIEVKTLLRNMNDKLEVSRKDNKHLQKQLAEQKVELEKKTDESNLVEELRAKNMALRQVALKAIANVGSLQKRVQVEVLPSSSKTTHDLEKLLKNAESGSFINEESTPLHSKKNRMLDVGESIEMLRPMVNDALKYQKDAVKCIQRLLQQSQATVKLTEKITSIDHESFAFEPTLKIVEQTITSTMTMFESLDLMLKSKEACNKRLVSLLNLNHLEEIHVDTGEVDEVVNHSTRINSIAQRHLEELQSLSKIVAQLPKVGGINLDADKQYVRKHLNVVDDITDVLNNALSKLVQDARQMKLQNLSFIGRKCSSRE